MEERRRRALRRGRARLVAALRVEPLWDLLRDRGVFTRTMIEDIQSAGSRGEQARQLLIDLETRGKQAFPIFLSILRDTGQGELADLLLGEGELPLVPPQLRDLQPVPLDLPGEKHNESGNFPEPLSIPVQAESDRPPKTQGLAVDKRNQDLEMVSELQKLARQDHSTLDCCIVVILSHGCQTSHIQFPGGVFGTDGKPIPIEKIVNYFTGSHCPSLRGKPKLFFIQACGGEQRDRGFVVDSDPPGDEAPGGSSESDATPFQPPAGNVDEPDAVASLPTPSDILVSYSTFPGFVSWREASSGSWYVETLDSVLEQYAPSEDLLNMLLRVAHAVSAKGKYKQIPGCFNFLRKKFFFRCK
ncbi:caspase-9 isoform X2 [Apus apus]|uniref:caspase-9 isoform X2 n=1 Tax=Apus apus TaxID=8895 RepID=UPI0021F84F7F|nr:caspase-9 isoform X2 [Apus apus]